MFCGGRPVCRPVRGFREEACSGGHIGPPLREAGRYLGTNGNWRGTGPCRGRGRTVYGGVWSPRPTGATLVVRSNGPMWASAPTEGVGSFINHPGQSAHQRRTIPQSPYGRQLPLHKGAFGDGLQRWQCAATGRCGHRPLRVRWLGPSGAELRLFSLHTRVFSSGREKETRGQGLALPPRVLMGIAYFWQVLRKR